MESLSEQIYEIEVKAQIGGTFFAYPVINVGDKIKKGQKIYSIGGNHGFVSEIESEYSGIVKEIFAKDNANVNYNDKIILLEVDNETYNNYKKVQSKNKNLNSRIDNMKDFDEVFSIKNYILKEGRKFIDRIAIFDIIISIIVLLAGIIMGLLDSSWSTFWSCLGIAFVYYQITLIKNYAIYLFIDMRDSLNKINQNIKK